MPSYEIDGRTEAEKVKKREREREREGKRKRRERHVYTSRNGYIERRETKVTVR